MKRIKERGLLETFVLKVFLLEGEGYHCTLDRVFYVPSGPDYVLVPGLRSSTPNPHRGPVD